MEQYRRGTEGSTRSSEMPAKARGESLMLRWALWYGKEGLPVFPIHSAIRGKCSCGTADCDKIAKHPRTPHGFKDATTDRAQIAAWWRKWPDANIGVPTGASSRLIVIDIDPRHGGEESWKNLRANRKIPRTAKQRTGGGGRHIIFRNPGGRVPKELAPGIDLKGNGGYIVSFRLACVSQKQ